MNNYKNVTKSNFCGQQGALGHHSALALPLSAFSSINRVFFDAIEVLPSLPLSMGMTLEEGGHLVTIPDVESRCPR